MSNECRNCLSAKLCGESPASVCVKCQLKNMTADRDRLAGELAEAKRELEALQELIAIGRSYREKLVAEKDEARQQLAALREKAEAVRKYAICMQDRPILKRCIDALASLLGKEETTQASDPRPPSYPKGFKGDSDRG